jgi:hypothetical protein
MLNYQRVCSTNTRDEQRQTDFTTEKITPGVPDEFGKELADFTGISQGIRIYCGWLRYPAVALMVLSH